MMRSSSTRNNNSGNNNKNNKNNNNVTISCEDCGNKAKRDCEHRRCRNCCITRGFKCHTHVKSTWIPVAKRRQRLEQQYQHFQLLSPSSRSTYFRHRNDFDLSGQEDANFPAEINSLATFKCIMVTSKENMVERQYAYQTSINIGGHIFKGVLYDQGPITTTTTATTTEGGRDQSSSAGTSDHNHHHLNMMTATTSTAQSGGGGANLLVYPSSHPHAPLNYSLPFNAFPGMQFFPNTSGS